MTPLWAWHDSLTCVACRRDSCVWEKDKLVRLVKRSREYHKSKESRHQTQVLADNLCVCMYACVCVFACVWFVCVQMCLYMYLLMICQHPKAPKIKRELRITKSNKKRNIPVWEGRRLTAQNSINAGMCCDRTNKKKSKHDNTKHTDRPAISSAIKSTCLWDAVS